MVKEGYKNTELGEIPVDWEVKQLKEICIGNCEYGINAAAKEFENGSIRYLRITDINNNYNLSNKEIKTVNANESDICKYILKEKDIVFARTGNTTGKSYLYNKKDGILVFAGFLIKFSIDSKMYNAKFLKYYVQSTNYWKWVKRMSLRSGQPGINSKEYSLLQVPVPPLPEQQKIAFILSTVDQHIEETEALIEKTKELKIGLMRKLLTKGIGHTEFKKTEVGEIPVEWEVKKLREVSEVVSGGTPSTNKQTFWLDGNIPWATPTDITSRSKYIRETNKNITYDGLKNSSANLLPVGSILMTSRATIGEKSINTVPIATNQGFKSFVCKQSLNNEFLYYLIDTLIPRLINLSSGSTFLEISKKEVENMKIQYPPLKEQIKIGGILLVIDDEIEEYNNKKEKLQYLKKGLMQQLLTGKKRVI
ncbi:restriction endonuclease subunit S [Vallitalea guaymasensis]|uniref:Restriction endonuclease subunit S n=1 Tax=Vallitalea guaymasensis TaxID=1185412 RepID=A0A8J8SEC3_9FIRM|nr:restriction endonuclease subunit S [Vallitalea guaymasensis]QUH31391.1 restriction endonuclease subunit S [Vallitalea guaymasensis]